MVTRKQGDRDEDDNVTREIWEDPGIGVTRKERETRRRSGGKTWKRVEGVSGSVTRSVQKDSWGLLLLDGQYSRRDQRPSSTVD